MFGDYLDKVRRQKPLIHNITNYVTARDCANILLACGASPIMADDPNEAKEVTEVCNGLTINMGTLNERRLTAMETAGLRANELGKPVVLDPVGAGVSSFRLEAAERLMKKVQFRAIRGNFSEIETLAGILNILSDREEKKNGGGRGVDAAAENVNPTEFPNFEKKIDLVRRLAAKTGAVVAATGTVDLVADAEKVFCIDNGHSMMGRITGAGCQLSALVTAFLAAEDMDMRRRAEGVFSERHAAGGMTKDREAVAAAVCMMGLCGEQAYQRMMPADGSGMYGIYLTDAVFSLTSEELERGGRYELR